MSAPLFEVEHLDFQYDPRRPILRDIHLTIPEGEFLGLMGPNGAGKSTLLGLLAGRLRPVHGTIRFWGRNIKQWPARELASHIGVIPQREETVFPFTAREVVLMGRYPHIHGVLGIESQRDFDIADAALARVDMADYADAPLTHLSGGERQLVLFARALAQEPEVLLLDEPASALDLSHKQLIFEILYQLNREKGVTVVTVSHDLNVAALYCKNLTLLSGGKFVASGRPEAVMEEGLLRQVFKASLRTGRLEDGHPFMLMTRDSVAIPAQESRQKGSANG